MNEARPVAVIDAVRTPIGKFLGAFQSLSAPDLGVHAVEALLERTGIDPENVDETIMGHGRQAGAGPNPARQVSIRSGIPQEKPAWTLNQACASGLAAIAQGARAIGCGAAEMIVAGGMESMTNTPYMLPRMRLGHRLGHGKVIDGMYQDGFHCLLADMLMGETAELLATEMGISRDEQDAYASTSQNKSEAARKAGKFDDEIVPVNVPQRKGDPVVVSVDEHPRDGMTPDKLKKLPAVFKEDGTVHAGNSSGITDGAAAVLLCSEGAVEAHGLEPIAWVGPSAVVGVDPKRMGIGPVPAMKRLFELTGRGMSEYDLIELNEAFAAQVLACQSEIPLPMEKLNVNGGAISLGHPIGCTGTRIVVTLVHEMKKRDAALGLATLCVSGGMGIAVEFRKER